MPIDVKTGDNVRRVEIPEGGVTIALEPGITPEIDPEHWVLFDLADFNAAESYLKQGDYSKARLHYNRVLKIDPTNTVALKMVKHLDYALKNIDKLNSNFFDQYIGRYELTPNYIQTVSKEEQGFFIKQSRRTKHQIYPISDNEFVLSNYDVSYIFIKDEDGTVKELFTSYPDHNISRHARRIEQAP